MKASAHRISLVRSHFAISLRNCFVVCFNDSLICTLKVLFLQNSFYFRICFVFSILCIRSCCNSLKALKKSIKVCLWLIIYNFFSNCFQCFLQLYYLCLDLNLCCFECWFPIFAYMFQSDFYGVFIGSYQIHLSKSIDLWWIFPRSRIKFLSIHIMWNSLEA